jgi:DNA-binding response OmpR family regulator
MRVLVAEDDMMIGQGLETALRQLGAAVDWIRDGEHAAAALRTTKFDLALLDLGLPNRDGLQILREVRQRGDATPIIVLTARDEIENRVAGLDAGADDYMVNARIRSVLRRAAGRSEPTIQHGDLKLDPATHSVEQRGMPVNLSAHEYSVLEALLQRPGAVLSRAQLEERLYGYNEPIGSNAVEVYIHGLRRKLGSDAIRTLRGVGYFIPK